MAFYIGIQKDITQEVLAKQDLMAIHEKNRQESMRETIAALAHEINQPLSTIALYSKSCQLIMSKESAEKRAAEIETSLQQMALQSLLVGEIIHRINNNFNETSFDRKWIDVNDEVKKLIDLLRCENFTYILDLQADLPLLNINPLHLTQIFLNLIKNSMEAYARIGQKNGLINIKTSYCKNKINFRLSDNGPGLPAEFRNLKLGSFFTSKPYGIGTGFGICCKMIKLYQGSLQIIQSHPGFIIEWSLPV